MNEGTTSTNTPFAEASTSSSPHSPHNYTPTSHPAPRTTEASFNPKEILIYGGGLVLTAIITYFSTLISVNSDISNNREHISVLKSGISHIRSDLGKAEKNIEKNGDLTSRVGIINVKISGLERLLDAHISAVGKEKDITK